MIDIDAMLLTDAMPQGYHVYLLREAGSIEIRYVGFSKDPVRRLESHRANAKRASSSSSPFANWLNTSDVEMVALIGQTTEAAALERESQMIGLFSRLGHRLFNIHHNAAKPRKPADQQVAA